MENKYQSLFKSTAPAIYNELPTLKTDPIIKWLKEEIFKKRYLFYSKPKHEAICSNCGIVDMPDDVKNNEWGECPKCHAKVQYKSAGIGRGKLEGYARVLIFQKRGKTVYATTNFIYADYSEGEVKLYKDIDGVFKFNRKEQQGHQTNCTYFYGEGWNEQKNIRVPYRAGKWAEAPIYLYKENLKQVFKGTDLKYCELAEQAGKWYPESFLKLVNLNAKYESIEKLHKVGLDNLIESKLLNEYGSGAVRWKKTELKDILQLTKPEIIKAREAKANLRDLEIYKIAKQIGISADFKKVKYDIDTLKVLKKYAHLIKPTQLYKYISKQSKKRKFYHSISLIAKDYRDYIGECQKLELDLTNKTILLPKDLQDAHARTSAQVQIMANEEQQKKIIEKAKRMKKFNFQTENLLIRIAETAEEIIIEGKLMGHCVGGYVERVAEGRTNIFFVRKVAQPDEPYYTLELKKKSGKYEMIQCRGGGRGKKNGAMTEEVEMFVDKWMAEAVNAKPKKRKKVA